MGSGRTGQARGRWISVLGIVLIGIGAMILGGTSPTILMSLGQAGAPTLPELHPISLVLTPPSPVEKGVLVTARAKIVNTGNSAAPRFTVEFFYRIKSDPPRPWVSFPDGKGVISLPGLSPRDQTITVEGVLDTAKSEVEPGTYEIRVLVDATNQISEEDETNNELIVALQIRPSRLTKPDLVPTALLFTPPSPIDSQTTVTVSATVRNNGPVDAGAFDVQYLFCKLPTPRSTCAPEQLSEFAKASVPAGLKAGKERSGRDLHGTEIQFPNPRDPATTKLEPGVYLIQVRVDPTSKEQPSGAVEEQDEANNTLTALLTVKGPELFPESITITPTLVRAGSEALVTAQIANAGTTSADNVLVAFVINGRRFATATVPQIPAASRGEPTRQAVQVSLKTESLQPGVYELRVVVDPEDTISELDESNNTLTTALTLQPPLTRLPELTPKSLVVTPPSPIEQGKGTVIAEILNNGMISAEGFDVEFSVREAGRARWNPIPCTANCTNNKLNPNAELTAQAQLPALTPGAYEVRVVIDPQGRVAELDETNNEMLISFRVIRPRRPDLAITELAFDPPTLAAHRGQPVRILFTVENIGDALAEASDAQCSYRRLEDVTVAPVSFARVSVPSLAPGGKFAAQCQLDTGPPVRPGFYELTVTLDPQNTIEEQNEGNNIATSGTGIPGQPGQGQALLIFGPDLIPDRATLKVRRPKTPETIAMPLSFEITQGELLDLEVTVRNIGQIPAGGFDVAFCTREYFSQAPCAEIGTRSRTTGLGLADEFTAKTQVSTELIAPGVYEIGVIVDPPSPEQPFGRVEEVSELNNFIGGPRAQRGFQVIIVGKPDLTFREPLVFQPSGPVPPGTTLGIFADVQNIGAGRTTRDFKVEFAFRRADDPAQPNFVVFSTAIITELEVGPEKAKQVKAELDTRNLAPGLYEIQVQLDPDNLIPELNETNNIQTARVAIGGGAGLVDLAAVSFTLTPNQAVVSRGQIVRFSAVIANLGAMPSGPFVVEFTYRNLLSPSGTDPVFSRQTIANLDGGARATVTAQLNTISLSPGTYEIAVTVDPENRISEPDEANNRLVIFLTVN
jgi:subtilase family serine protease